MWTSKCVVVGVDGLVCRWVWVLVGYLCVGGWAQVCS